MKRFEYNRSSPIRSSKRIHHWSIVFYRSSFKIFQEAISWSRNSTPLFTSSKQFYSRKFGFFFLHSSIRILTEESPLNVFDIIITRLAFHYLPFPRREAIYFATYVVFPCPEFAIHKALTGGYLSEFFIIFLCEKKSCWFSCLKYFLRYKELYEIILIYFFEPIDLGP